MHRVWWPNGGRLFSALKNIIPHTNTPATAMKAKIQKLMRFGVGQNDLEGMLEKISAASQRNNPNRGTDHVQDHRS
jgi:hypothetical protein